jgi:hypothetical protein
MELLAALWLVAPGLSLERIMAMPVDFAVALLAGRTAISSQRASPEKGEEPKSRVVWNTPSVTDTGVLVRMGPTWRPSAAASRRRNRRVLPPTMAWS